MANVTVDNGVLSSYIVSTVAAAGSVHVQRIELVTAIEGGAITSLAKAEDTPHASGDFGFPIWAVRKDTPAALAGSDGDYAPLSVDGSGRAHTNVGSMPAAARTTDSISAVHATDALMDNLTVLTPKFVSVTIAASQTDATVVAAVTSKKIRVIAGSVTCGATATTLTLESDEGSDVRLDKIAMGANGGKTYNYCPVGHFQTAAGSALIATTGAGSDTEITLTYVEIV